MRIMILAGEVSGDEHAAALVRELKTLSPECELFGMGGDAMRAEGVELFYHTNDLAVMGIVEVLQKYGFFRGAMRRLLEVARERKPDVIVTVDYPGFNLRFARKAKAEGFKLVHYIAPKVWAWKRGRIPKIAAAYDRLITIFPFVNRHFEGTGLDCVYVGNPLVDVVQRTRAEAETVELPWEGRPRLALLPGSRRHEVERLLPVMLRTVAILEKTYPNLSCVIPAPNETVADLVHDRTEIPVLAGKAHHILRQADAALVASGTATLDASLMRCPMVICYRMATLSAMIIGALLRIKYVGLVNIVAGRTVCPELLQHSAVPARLAAAVAPLLADTPKRRTMLEGLDEVNAALGEPGCAARAAEAVLEVV